MPVVYLNIYISLCLLNAIAWRKPFQEFLRGSDISPIRETSPSRMAVELILRHAEATEWASILIHIRDMPADGTTGGRLNGRIQIPCFLEAARLAGRT